MSTNNEMGKVGVDPPIERLIRQYYPNYPQDSLGQLLSDPSVALLAVLARQNQDSGTYQDTTETQDVEASYYADKYLVTSDGPRNGDGSTPENVDGKQIDLGFPVDTFDLRFTDAITVAFQGPNNQHRTIEYRAGDSPVVGKAAETRYVYVARAASATSDPTLWIEGDLE